MHPNPPKAKHRTGCLVATIIGVIAVALFGFGGCMAMLSSGAPEPSDSPAAAAPTHSPTHKAKHHHTAAPTDKPTAKTTTEPEWTPTPKATHHAAAHKVIFKVSGSAPGGVDIMYGSDSDNRQGHGLPFTATLPLHDDAMYYDINAQLTGGGDIKCSVTIDGQTKRGHASGGYNICSAQLNGGIFGGWSSMTGAQPHAGDGGPWYAIGRQVGAEAQKQVR